MPSRKGTTWMKEKPASTTMPAPARLAGAWGAWLAAQRRASSGAVYTARALTPRSSNAACQRSQSAAGPDEPARKCLAPM